MCRLSRAAKRLSVWLATVLSLAACGGGSSGDAPAAPPVVVEALPDAQLHQLIEALELTGDPSTGRDLPSIDAPLPQLGKKLFFSKSLSGDLDTACASCHHPALGGGDRLSLAVGAGAHEADLVGPGRASRRDPFPRNAPTTFNVGLYDSGLFQDSRIESIGKIAGANGAGSAIRTPDTPFNVDDPTAGNSLPAAQARFPVTVPAEMRGDTFEQGRDNQAVRDHLAARLGNYGIGAGELGPNRWLEEFRLAFGSAARAEELITFDNIALALGEYLRSQTFVDTPWRAYVRGDNAALGAAAKRGALLFFREPPRGAGCARCHRGDFFTSEEHHAVGFPQIGPGFGDGEDGGDDFGRARETGEPFDRYRFRTPALLNLAVTAPYTHAGAYQTLEQVVEHYRAPAASIDAFFGARGGPCGLPQFAADAQCPSRLGPARERTTAALAKLGEEQVEAPADAAPDLGGLFTAAQMADIVEFLLALTDPCVQDRSCLSRWIPSPGDDPDGHQLIAVDRDGHPL